jgi:hypothetical protein
VVELGAPESLYNRCGGRKLSGCAAHEDDCAKCGRVVCSFCGQVVIPRVGSYWFLLLSPRGRCRFPGAEELRGKYTGWWTGLARAIAFELAGSMTAECGDAECAATVRRQHLQNGWLLRRLMWPSMN